ncbi:PREDICTED: UPF0496 protein At1g20180-like [Ipomoea nil]|uniref:UPF0496 protein At1g20180-like n=1 Tax=Ipomoea nil TaxID=35883 RepID=UPI0009010501|nr:PREDICTED: UPF0496 protein At1g20180-like [Ipomoea nil]
MHLPLFKKFSKMKSAFITKSPRRNSNENEGSLGRKSSSVSHEYMAAFRTNSYVEIYDKVQGQLAAARSKEIVGGDNTFPLTSSSSSSSSPLISGHESLPSPGCKLLLCQENMEELPQQASNAHPLLNEYFLLTLEACAICESLLKIVLQTRADYKSVKKAVEKIEELGLSSEEQVNRAYGEIASLSLFGNTLSAVRFDDVRDDHLGLLSRLTSKRGRIERRTKRLRVFKVALGSTLLIGCTAFMITFTILAVHFVVCTMAVPGLIALSLGMVKKLKEAKRGIPSRKGLYMPLDVAAKGLFVLINDLSTVSRLVGRLSDEMEHNKTIADLWAMKHCDDVLKEVVSSKNFAIQEEWALEVLKELEQHIYLCFLNIVRSRRMIVQEIVGRV